MDEEEKKAKDVWSRMAGICSRTEQCSGDIRQKILTSGLTGGQADDIVEKLKAEKFINDERYVMAYVSDKFRLNKWGKVKIRHYLKAKGLPDVLIQTGLDTIDDDRYRQVLIKTMKEKARAVKKKPRYEKMGQIIRFAQNRGFEPELIHRYLNEVVE